MILKIVAVLLLGFTFALTTEDIKTTQNKTYKINLIKTKGNVVKLIGKPPITSTSNKVSFFVVSDIPSPNTLKKINKNKTKKAQPKVSKNNKVVVVIPTKNIAVKTMVVVAADIKPKVKKEIIVVRKPIAVYKKKILVESRIVPARITQNIVLQRIPYSQTLLSLTKSMTPEEAYKFHSLLVAKTFQPVEENFFTNLGFGMDMTAQFINPQRLNNVYGSVFGNITSAMGAVGSVRYKLDKNSALGFDIGNFNNNSNKVVSKVYEEFYLKYGVINLVYDQKIINQEGFVLKASVGGGFLYGGYSYIKTDENVAVPYTYIKDRTGIGYDFTIALQPRIKMNKIWDVGLDIGYLFGKITELKKANVVDTTAPELDFTGFYVGFISTLNL